MQERYASVIEAHFDVVSHSGREYLCKCPWHDDSGKPNLYINSASGLFLCMSCGKKGHLDQVGLPTPLQSTEGVRDRLRAMTAKATGPKTYPESWLRQFDFPHPYWTEERGLDAHTVARFGLGYDVQTNRMTLPLRDYRGNILGVTYRRLDDQRPKYINPKGYPLGRHLYGAWLVEEQSKVALVEGQVDAIKCWSERVPAIALMGSRLTQDQRKVLQRLGIRKVVLMLDNDSAGVKGTVGVYEMLRGSGIQVVAGWYRDYWSVKDPDGLKGDRLRKMYHSAVPLPSWAERTGVTSRV